ncbi:MAG TPA: dihydroorotate dehydrogenase [Ktedonobacteraceae bacterium]|nr:dihydroorotate dehydrogenase [Ktedonobacteraceae bacterium]
MNLQTELAPRHKSGLLLKNPVMTAAGTFGYGLEYAKIAEIQRLGAIVCKGTTLHSRSGNAHPRTWETASGMLNAIGLQNPGVHRVVEKYAPIWETWETPVIVNIAGETVREFVQIAEYLEGVPGVAGIEVNVSCPNVQEGGAVFGDSPGAVASVTAAVRRETTLPLIVKLSPNMGDVRPTAIAAASAGADAISLINTITGLSIDIHARRPTLANTTGGLSGPAVKPIALRMVYEVARELHSTHPHVPIIGLGGITNASDALEFLMAGASAIQIGTINFVNPRAGVEIIEGIEAFMRDEGIEDVREIIGIAL